MPRRPVHSRADAAARAGGPGTPTRQHVRPPVLLPAAQGLASRSRVPHPSCLERLFPSRRGPSAAHVMHNQDHWGENKRRSQPGGYRPGRPRRERPFPAQRSAKLHSSHLTRSPDVPLVPSRSKRCSGSERQGRGRRGRPSGGRRSGERGPHQQNARTSEAIPGRAQGDAGTQTGYGERRGRGGGRPRGQSGE